MRGILPEEVVVGSTVLGVLVFSGELAVVVELVLGVLVFSGELAAITELVLGVLVFSGTAVVELEDTLGAEKVRECVACLIAISTSLEALVDAGGGATDGCLIVFELPSLSAGVTGAM